jgi:hypothetical protein
MDISESTYTWSEVDRALIAIFNIDESRLGAFHGRLKNLNKLNVTFLPRPGKGKRVSYIFEHIWYVAVFVALQEAGMMPAYAVELLNKNRFSLNLNVGYFLVTPLPVSVDRQNSGLVWGVPYRSLDKTLRLTLPNSCIVFDGKRVEQNLREHLRSRRG